MRPKRLAQSQQRNLDDEIGSSAEHRNDEKTSPSPSARCGRAALHQCLDQGLGENTDKIRQYNTSRHALTNQTVIICMFSSTNL
jgi:hypothetical protein